jgi:hypothetical protein
VTARLRGQAEERLRRARRARAEALNQASQRPSHIDPVSDRLDQADRLRRLEALDPETRAVMLRDAARQGAEPELLRAALTSPVPPFATKAWVPLVSEETAQELREFIVARRAPETVQDLRTVWRLDGLANALQVDRAGGTTPAPPRTLEELQAIRIGVR